MTRVLTCLVALAALLFVPACGGGGVSGTYVFDGEASLAQTDLGEDAGPMGDMLKGMFENVKSELTLSGDNTYEVWAEGMGMGEDRNEMKGTWKQKDDQITFSQTHEDGVEKKDETTMTMKDGTLTMSEEGPGGQTMAMVYKKK